MSERIDGPVARCVFALLAVAAACISCSFVDVVPSVVPRDLVDRFPSTVGGEPLEVEPGNPGWNEQTDAPLLRALGVDVDEVVYLTTSGAFYPCAEDRVCVAAYQYPGVPEQVLAREYVELRRRHDAEPEPMRRDDDRLVFTSRTGPEGDLVYLVRDDALYIINGDDALVEELIVAIP